MSVARFTNSARNRLGSLIAKAIPLRPIRHAGTQGRGRTLVLICSRWEYGSPLNPPGYEITRFLPALRQLFRNVTFVPIEAQKRICQWLRSLPLEEPSIPVLSVFQKADQIPNEYFSLPKDRFFLINWCTDDDMLFDSFSTKVAQHFDLNVTTYEPNLSRYATLGARATLSQWAGIDGVQPRTDKTYLGCFIGRMYGVRAELAAFLKKKFGKEVYVHDTRIRSLRERDMLELYRASYIAIDEPTAFDGRHLQIKARIFESASLGNCVVTKLNPLLNRYFTAEKEILYYRTFDDLADILNDCRNHPDRYLKIGLASHDRARRDHTYLSRFSELFGSHVPHGSTSNGSSLVVAEP